MRVLDASSDRWETPTVNAVSPQEISRSPRSFAGPPLTRTRDVGSAVGDSCISPKEMLSRGRLRAAPRIVDAQRRETILRDLMWRLARFKTRLRFDLETTAHEIAHLVDDRIAEAPYPR
jgi:hypothetical protein